MRSGIKQAAKLNKNTCFCINRKGKLSLERCSLDSEDDLCWGCQSRSHQQLFFSELHRTLTWTIQLCEKLYLHKIEVTGYNSLNTLFFFKFPARQTHNVCQNNVRNPHVHGYELEIKHTLCVLVVKICKRVNVLFWPALTPGTWRIIQNVLHSSFVAANCLLGSKFVLLHVHVHVCWALMWKEHN